MSGLTMVKYGLPVMQPLVFRLLLLLVADTLCVKWGGGSVEEGAFFLPLPLTCFSRPSELPLRWPFLLCFWLNYLLRWPMSPHYQYIGHPVLQLSALGSHVSHGLEPLLLAGLLVLWLQPPTVGPGWGPHWTSCCCPWGGAISLLSPSPCQWMHRLSYSGYSTWRRVPPSIEDNCESIE
jgi:hypothetical protein